MLVSLSWRNVWRNPTRSMVVVVAVALGLWGGVTAMALINGWVKQRIADSIQNEISHIKIHNPDFLLNEEVDKTFSFDSVAATLDSTKGIVGFSGRLKVFAMAQTDRANSGLVVLGVRPSSERSVSGIPNNLIMGSFLEGDFKTPSIVLGKKAAEELKLVNYELTDSIAQKLSAMEPRLGEQIQTLVGRRYRTRSNLINALKAELEPALFNHYSETITDSCASFRLNGPVVLTFQTPYGELHSAMFRVRGIYRTSNTAFDARMAYVNFDNLALAANINPSQVHEVAILCNGNTDAVNVAKTLSATHQNLKVRSWDEISPEIALYAAFGDFMGMIYVVIILFALAFGIINTMMMSVLERYREFGMLMAIGMNRLRVFSMIMMESVFLTLTGGVAGIVLSTGFIKIFARTGIDFGMWAEGFEAIGYSSVVYPEITTSNYVLITVLVVATGILASLWPARRALKLNPMQALRVE
ncbi:MAG: ABC transporter permease [Bacteroidales bacterium]|uniref:ABC transporter permease n=4 Tax=Tenuifilum sp. TaxID=2760880 RepID=UPI001B41DC4F|nr:ABC transporter permease [Bacteroidales bacterium]HOK85239.1 FtsX-like permease family protein [Tenuifilum sp.]